MGREGDHHWTRRRRGWRSRLPVPRWSGNPGTSPASLSSGIHPRSLLTQKEPFVNLFKKNSLYMDCVFDWTCTHVGESVTKNSILMKGTKDTFYGEHIHMVTFTTLDCKSMYLLTVKIWRKKFDQRTCITVCCTCIINSSSSGDVDVTMSKYYSGLQEDWILGGGERKKEKKTDVFLTAGPNKVERQHAAGSGRMAALPAGWPAVLLLLLYCRRANDRETLYGLCTSLVLGHEDDDTKAHGCSFVDRSQG